MNSSNLHSEEFSKKQDSADLENTHPAQFTLTFDQFTMIQHHLPKRFVLKETKISKRPHGVSMKHFQEQPNISKISANVENTEQLQKSKRQRIKKVDRYLDEQAPTKEQPRRSATEKTQFDDQMIQCLSILNALKKHRLAGPFLQPVNPKQDGAQNYFDIIKQPMDLSTVQNNLKSNQYQNSSQFHADICKIWNNSYSYNDKMSPLFKVTTDIQKYYKNLLTNDSLLSKSMVKTQKSKQKQRKKVSHKQRSEYGDDKIQKRKKKVQGSKKQQQQAGLGDRGQKDDQQQQNDAKNQKEDNFDFQDQNNEPKSEKGDFNFEDYE